MKELLILEAKIFPASNSKIESPTQIIFVVKFRLILFFKFKNAFCFHNLASPGYESSYSFLAEIILILFIIDFNFG